MECITFSSKSSSAYSFYLDECNFCLESLDFRAQVSLPTPDEYTAVLERSVLAVSHWGIYTDKGDCRVAGVWTLTLQNLGAVLFYKREKELQALHYVLRGLLLSGLIISVFGDVGTKPSDVCSAVINTLPYSNLLISLSVLFPIVWWCFWLTHILTVSHCSVTWSSFWYNLNYITTTMP